MPQLLILIGIPCSGKTTFAERMVAENPGAVRVNKDDIRARLYPNRNINAPTNPKIERRIRDESRMLIKRALKSGAPMIIVDDTNINPVHANYLIDQVLPRFPKYTYELHFFIISPEEALRRNVLRERQVPEKVIYSFYEKFRKRMLEGIFEHRGNAVIHMDVKEDSIDDHVHHV